MTAILECLRTEAMIGRSAASVASFHKPRHPGVMRPIASTAVASMQNIAAPDSASVLMWVKCQSVASPFSAEYWHIGATMMRLGSDRPRSWNGENRVLMRGNPGVKSASIAIFNGGPAITSAKAVDGAMRDRRGLWTPPAIGIAVLTRLEIDDADVVAGQQLALGLAKNSTYSLPPSSFSATLP